MKDGTPDKFKGFRLFSFPTVPPFSRQLTEFFTFLLDFSLLKCIFAIKI